MRVSAKTDYALRAAVELAAAHGNGTPVKGERLATTQSIPLRFLENILLQLRHAGIGESRPGAAGRNNLPRPPEEITLADVIRAIDGPLAGVSGQRPETLDFKGTSEPLRDVWIAVRASLRGVLEGVTLADVASGGLPDHVRSLTDEPDAWLPH
jgi:Rrf2 family protein